MNKQGILIFEIGLWIVRIMLLIIIIAAVALQIRAVINAKVNMDVAEPAVLIRILETLPVFLYQNAAGTVENAVSLERFTALTPGDVATVLNYQKLHAAAKLTLMGPDKKEIKTVFLNPDYYARLNDERNLGIVTSAERTLPVTIMATGKPDKGFLFVEVLQPR